MHYQRSHDIETRLTELVRLIRDERHSTLTLAAELGVSRPTVARCIAALRERGYVIQSVKDAGGWSYQLTAVPDTALSG